jgi:cytochrome c-type biogenesis protein CcmH/NrfG
VAVFTGAIYSLRGKRGNETLHKLRNDVLERPDDVEAWYELAAAALDEGALEEARRAMTHVLERAPDHLGAHRVLAVIEGSWAAAARP